MRISIHTVLCAAPQVIDRFKTEISDYYHRLIQTAVKLFGTCAEAYMGNRLCASEAVFTYSNKLRAFTPARMFLDDGSVQVIVTGQIPGRV